MTSLRKHVAEAIQRDQNEGGTGILRPEEVEALEWAMMAPRSGAPAETITAHEQEGDRHQHRQILAALLAELGPHRMRLHGFETRTDAYYLHCADVAIEAYDDWLAKRTAQGEVVREGMAK